MSEDRGLSWITSDYLGLPRIILDYHGLSGIYWIISDYLEYMEYFGLSWIILDYFGLFREVYMDYGSCPPLVFQVPDSDG